MYLNQTGEIPFYQFEKLKNQTGVLHFASTRHGGTSTGDCGTLNMDFTEDDSIENILENRNRMAISVGFNPDAYVFSEQVHGDNVVIINNIMKGSGLLNKESHIPSADAMITNEPGICLITKTADCVPIVLYDPVKRVIASIHTGWRGTMLRIAAKTVEVMLGKFNCKPKDIIAGIGPSIGACCYEVGDDVINTVQQTFGNTDNFLKAIEGKEKRHLDLWYTNRYILENIGLLPDNIEVAELCTSCNTDFFSWRRDGKTTGRLATGIILNE